MKRQYSLILVFIYGLYSCGDQDNESEKLEYPVTTKVDAKDIYYGTEINDPYRWLEDDNSEETAEWVKAQNELTQGYLQEIPFRDKLEDRLEELYNYERVYAPFERGKYTYFYKNDGLQNQNVLYRKETGTDGDEVFLNPNEFSEEGTISLATISFSEGGGMFSYAISEGGSDWRKIITIDVESKEIIDDTVRHVKFSDISWKGNDGFYYTRYEKPEEGEELSGINANGMIYYHKIGNSQSDDELIYRPEGEKIGAGATVTEDEQYLVISPFKGTSGNQLLFKNIEKEGEIIPIIETFENNHSVIGTSGNNLLVLTDLEAPNYRLVSIDPENPNSDNWVDVIPETENVLRVTTGGGMLFANYLQDAKTAIMQYDFKGNHIRDVELPGIGTVSGFSTESDKEELYYTFTSFTSPPSIYRYKISTGDSELYNQPDVKFDPADYETKQVFYESKDGTKIPMFIVHKKGITLDGSNPTYLYAYGGFNVSLTPRFSTSRIAWLENGGVYAQPSLRGGGEYGEEWHKAGTKMQKQNVFDDFIAAAEYLIAEKYTSSDKLVIAGGSNGGLLVGATMTQRPDLMKVALPAVGVMDMLRYHKFTIGWAWASDYGTVDDSNEMFEYLHNYSPLHNIEEGVEYPATLITTADHDDRVVPAHSFKFAATLQEKHAGENPVLIRIETDAGHGAGTPISKTIEKQADIYSFIWYNMGVDF